MSSVSSVIARPAPAFAPTGRFRTITACISRLYTAAVGLAWPPSRRRDTLHGLSAYMLEDLGVERLELPGGLVDYRPLPQFEPDHRPAPGWPADVHRGLDLARGL
jgi:hypothetical protein